MSLRPSQMQKTEVRMRERLLIGLAAMLAAGCTTSQIGLMNMEASGNLRVERDRAAADVFLVSVKSVRDVDFNGNDPGDRLKLARAALASECAAIELLEETQTQLGTYLTGQPRITFELRVKCQRG